MSHRAIAVVLVAIATCIASSVRADPRADFELGRSHFGNGHYERAVETFAALLAAPVDPRSPDARKLREIQQAARPLYAASLVALGRASDADQVILEQFRDDPFYEPPAGQLPEPVMQRFLTVSSRHAAELEGLRESILRERQEAILREQREKEAKVAPAPTRVEVREFDVVRSSRLVAAVPFGVGQFQNGNRSLGTFFAVSEGLGALASLGTLIAAQRFASADCRVEDCGAARSGFEATRAANWISVGITTALVVAGIVEAQVTLVPERRASRPPSPAPLKIDPVVTPVESGATLGFSAAF
ncbi:MAG: hypothetical protein FJ096_09135 [Deltaproteobacteria bacterium]|nr:hypothetical protein [Deltaproteobacteria bacterium]